MQLAAGLNLLYILQMNERIFSKCYGQVQDLLWPARKEWYNLGTALEVKIDKLEVIKKNNPSNCDDCFNAMLKSCSETNTSLTWTGVCEALRKPKVARNDVADDVAEKIEEEIQKIPTNRKRSHQNSVGGSVASDSDAYEETFEEEPGITIIIANNNTAQHNRSLLYIIIML